MKIYLSSDHAGFELKEQVKLYLINLKLNVEDCGALSKDQTDDYPDFISIAAEKVSKEPSSSMGIIFGGSGQGEMMVANKFKNVRCGLFYNTAIPKDITDISGSISDDPFEIVRLLREHNNANMLSFAARFLDEKVVLKAIDIFLNTSFSGDERHLRRLNKILDIEHKNYA